MSDQQLIPVKAAPTFQRNLRQLAKKYRNIRNDIQPLIEQLEGGELPGDAISGIDAQVFKVRVRNSDIQKGKSGGYRLIYYVKTTQSIILLMIYSKSEQVNIAANEIRDVIIEYEKVTVGDELDA